MLNTYCSSPSFYYYDPDFLDNFQKSLKLFRGVLLYGEKGVGKTYFVKNYLTEGNTFFYYNCSEIFHEYIGHSERYLRDIFKNKGSGSVIILDDVDIILPKTNKTRLDLILLSELQQCFSSSYVILGISHSISVIDHMVLNLGYFEKTIEMKVPTRSQREKILEHYASPSVRNEIKSIVTKTNGYTLPDLLRLLRDYNGIVNPKHKLLDSSSYRDIKFSNIVGYKNTISRVKRAVIYPFSKASVYRKVGVCLVKGVLLYGPPGCGKTTFACAIANEIDANFIPVECNEVISKVVGESARKIENVFRLARSCAPSVVFFDQFEMIARTRNTAHRSMDQMLSTLLVEMDGIRGNDNDIIVLAATNRIDLIDPAILRPGRIDEHILINSPNTEQINLMWKKFTQNIDLYNDVDKDFIIKKMANYSISRIKGIIREAVLAAIRENKKIIKMKHFVNSFNNTY